MYEVSRMNTHAQKYFSESALETACQFVICLPCSYIHRLRITNLLHSFAFVVFDATCFGLESLPFSGRYETFRHNTEYLATDIYVSGRIHHCQFVVKL